MVQHRIRVGLPRALPYYKYAPMWTTFLKALGCELVTSPETNRRILETGSQYAIDENCLAVKIYLGHVEALLGKVDYILIPRLVSLYPGEEMCIKFFSLGDVVRSTFGQPPLLEYTVDMNYGRREWPGFFRMGMRLTRNPIKVWRAYRAAKRALHQHRLEAVNNQLRRLRESPQAGTRVLIVSHSYVINDAFMGKRVTRLLKDLDVEMIFADVVEETQARERSAALSSDIYWSHHRELLGAIALYKDCIDGILFVVAFPCGPDALTVQLCQHRVTDLPLCVINLDELQGDAGLKTRLESFVDILRLKKETLV